MTAGLKALESSTTIYNTKLVAVEDARILREGEVRQDTCLTHELVRDLDVDVCRMILRVPTESLDMTSLGAQVSDATINLRGPMGWMPEIRQIVSGRPSTSSLLRSSRPSTQRLTNEASRLATEYERVSVREDKDSFKSLMSGLDNGLRTGLIESTDRLVESLIDLVLPTVAEAYVKISRNCPQDPVQFIADFLREKGVEKESSARESAHKAFLAALEEASVRESKDEPMDNANSEKDKSGAGSFENVQQASKD